MSAPAPLRWGAIGATSWVATDAVLPAIAASPTAELVAVASRDPAAGRAVAERFGARRVHSGYQDLLDDDAVEAVYIPLPNALHAEWTLRAAAAGRHVLCEKPLACTAAPAERMVAACAAASVQLFEAYMTGFHPRTAAMLEICRSGELGELLSVDSVFAFPLEDATNHRWNAAMGGGALLDVGPYALAPLLELGSPAELVAAAARRTGGGVDATTSGWLRLGPDPAAAVAGFSCSFEAPELQRLRVLGTRAALTVDRPFTAGPDDTAIHLRGRDGAEVRHSRGANAYLAMVEHCAAVIRNGEPPRRPAATVLASMAMLDRVRVAAGGA